MTRFTFSGVCRLLVGFGYSCYIEYLSTNGHNKSLLELTHFVGSELGSVLSEHDHEELSSESKNDLLDCISVGRIRSDKIYPQ